MNSTTTTYAVQIRSSRFSYSLAAWNCKRDGRPTEGNLATYVARLAESCAPGGCNEHLGDPAIKGAFIRHQGTGDIVAEIEVLV